MKKIKILAIILISTVICTGIGYAAWNQSIWINGTVSTGNFDVVWDTNNLVCAAAPYVTAKVEQDPSDPKHGLILSVDNLYPGAEVSFNPKALNVGSIPAKPENITIAAVDDQSSIFPLLEYYGGFTWSQDGSAVNGPEFITDNNWKPLNGLGTDLKGNTTFMDIELDPSGWLEFGKEECMHIRMNPDAPNDTSEGKTLKFKLSFDWVQAVP